MKTKILIVGALCGLLCVLVNTSERAISSENINSWEKEYPVPPQAEAGWDIVTYVGTETHFEAKATPGTWRITKYEWDFDGDGYFDWSSSQPEIAYHTYLSEGTYWAILKVTDEHDLLWLDHALVTVKSGTGQQLFVQPQVEKPIFAKGLSSRDGVVRRYAIIIGGVMEERFWEQVVDFYTAYNERLGIDTGDIYVMFAGGWSPDSTNPNQMIDYKATNACLDTVFMRLAQEDLIDADDQLHMVLIDHGCTNGFYLFFECLTASHLAEHLDNFEQTSVVVMMGSCYSGSFIPYLSQPKHITMTASRADHSASDCFLTLIADALLADTLADNMDIDGCISMPEVFNYSAGLCGGALYDDNGDEVGHDYPLPDSGDGIWGRSFCFEEGCPFARYLFYYSHKTNDSLGNNNGVVNPGETIRMTVTLQNVDYNAAENVEAILRTDDPWITITDDFKIFGNIDPTDTATSMGSYVFQVAPTCPDSHLVTFTLETYAGDTLVGSTSFKQIVVEQDFVIYAMPETLFTYNNYYPSKMEPDKGGCFGFRINVVPLGGFKSPVNLSALGFCPGITGRLTQRQVTPPGQSDLCIYLSLFCQAQICSTIVVTGSGGGITHKDTLMLVVRQSPPNYGPVWFVAPDGNDLLGDGKEDWPLRTIQKGVDLASIGDTVLVKKGVYYENVQITKDSIVVASLFARNGQESYVESTIIDGQNTGAVVTINLSDEATLEGFTIRNGYSDEQGGGIFCNSSNPRIEHNIITGNYAYGGGGGIFLTGSYHAWIFRNVIYDNSLSSAIYASGCGQDIQIVNNSISDNRGDGIVFVNAPLLVKNNIVSSNDGYGVRNAMNGGTTVIFCDVWGNISGNYLNIEDPTGTNGDISYDPLFVNLSVGDLHLTCNSPCIDSGDTADSVPPGGGPRIDMGAFEYIYVDHDSCGDVNGDGCISERDVTYLREYLYEGGPPPDPLETGDVNCDCIINMGDMVYLINYLYQSGPPPCSNGGPCCQSK